MTEVPKETVGQETSFSPYGVGETPAPIGGFSRPAYDALLNDGYFKDQQVAIDAWRARKLAREQRREERARRWAKRVESIHQMARSAFRHR